MGISGVRIPREEIIEAIKVARGNINHIAAHLGCAPSAVYDWKKKDPKINAMIEEERLKFRYSLVHKAENALEKKIDDGDTASILFALKTQGRDIGYSQDDLSRVATEFSAIVRGQMDKAAKKSDGD